MSWLVNWNGRDRQSISPDTVGTTVQLDQSAYFDKSCYAIVHAPEPHVVLDWTSRAKLFDSAWETADSLIFPLGPRDYTLESGEGGHFLFLIQKWVPGIMVWSAQWNDHPHNYEATSSLGDDFDLIIGTEASHLADDLYWSNSRPKNFFKLSQSYSLWFECRRSFDFNHISVAESLVIQSSQIPDLQLKRCLIIPKMHLLFA